jgi:general secretion pathway protein G
MPRRRSASPAGFTLIELMVVIVILGLLVGIVGPNVNRFLIRGKIATAKTQMANIEAAIDAYKLDKRRLPDTLNELIQGDGEGYLPGSEIPRDPWGGEYRYERIDKKRYELICLGADGVEGGESEDERDIRREDIRKQPGDEEQ